MIGLRNLIIALVAIATTTWIVILGIQYSTDMLALATVIGAKDAAAAACIFGRGYNKKITNGKETT